MNVYVCLYVCMYVYMHMYIECTSMMILGECVHRDFISKQQSSKLCAMVTKLGEKNP